MKEPMITIFNTLKNNSVPKNMVTEDQILSNSNKSSRGNPEVTYAEYSGEGNTYYVIRISRVEESQTQAIQRNIRNPHKPNKIDKEFLHCEYQLGKFELPLFRENKNTPHWQIHESCKWNSRRVSRLRTVSSSSKLQRAWRNFKHKNK